MADENETTLFTTELDWSSDVLTENEWQSISAWYEDVHGMGNLDFVKFIPFMKANRPDALKYYRRWVETVPAGVKLEGEIIPGPGMAMIWLHFYITIGYREGVLYEIIAARVWGASKADIQQVLAIGWIHSGPYGMNATATVAEEYLAAWDDDDIVAGGINWPEGWAPFPELFLANLDYRTSELPESEIKSIVDWHLKWEGETPPYVTFLAEHYPLALKVFRQRYEATTRGPLPAQLVVLFELHVALIQKMPSAAKRIAVHAKALGASKSQIIQVAANSHVYLGDIGMDVVADALETVLADWT